MLAQRADQPPATLLRLLLCRRPCITMGNLNTDLDRAAVHLPQAPCRLRAQDHLKDDLLSLAPWLFQVQHRLEATSAYGAAAVTRRQYLPTHLHSMMLATMVGQ